MLGCIYTRTVPLWDDFFRQIKITTWKSPSVQWRLDLNLACTHGKAALSQVSYLASPSPRPVFGVCCCCCFIFCCCCWWW